MAQGGRQYQDSLFRSYFNNEANLRELAGALHGKVYAADEPIEIVTLDGAFLSQLKNDISFIIAKRHLVFAEHQSTPSRNMPLRCLFYVNEQLRQRIKSKSLFQASPVSVPWPEFHVFYTGRAEEEDAAVLRLSDSFLWPEGEGARPAPKLDLLVTAHNIAYGNSKELLQSCRAMRDYSYFVSEVKRNSASGLGRLAAIRKAIRDCIERDVMRDYLLEHETEAEDMVSLEWDEAAFREAAFEDGRELGLTQGISQGITQGISQGISQGITQGISQGLAQGREEGRVALAGVALNLLKAGMAYEDIAKNVGIPLEEVRSIAQGAGLG